MATGQDLVNAACRFIGEPYSTAPGRDDPNSGYKDCSGLIAASYLVATGRPLGANVSVTIYDLAARHGLTIPFSLARTIPGACLLMPEDPYKGWGPAGHIGFSDGNGGTVEATPPRVQRLPVSYQPWGTNACLLPGINYSGSSETTKEIPAMFIAWGQTVFGVPAAALISGSKKVLDLSGPAGAYGVPQPAVAWKSLPGRDAVPLILLDPQSLGALVA